MSNMEVIKDLLNSKIYMFNSKVVDGSVFGILIYQEMNDCFMPQKFGDLVYI